jgi:cysteine-S-conjugate beta-lyase
MNFDETIERRGTHSAKWDLMETLHGVSPKDGISMWVADMDFRPPQCVNDALVKMADHGVFGYFGDDDAYRSSIQWWMKNRHGWDIEKDWIYSTHGLVNGTAMCVETWTEPGDGVLLFTPIYYVFYRTLEAAGRKVVECPLANVDGRYEMDLDLAQSLLTGNEKMVILCSPHNPGGRVWSAEELRAVADFCVKNDLMLVSDEIHLDLVYPGEKHTIMDLAAPDISDRLVMLTACTKTFNLAGAHTGNIILKDEKLRAKFAVTMDALGISPNSFGLHMITAAYSPEGAAWVDALMAYLDENRRIFDAGINAIPGAKSMTMEGTYLSWVDFSDTGMTPEEITRRVRKEAKLAAHMGDIFGKGGDSFMRFNIGMPKSVIREAVTRMQAAFADMQ